MVKTISSDPVIIITGASSGIGEATARLFASKGYRVVLTARRIEQLNDLAQDIQSKGGRAMVVVTDITKNDQIENLVSQTLDHFGQIDILLNNAGLGRLEWLENLDPINDIEYQIKVNLIGMIQMTRAVLPFMIKRKQGHIINIGSIAGLIATPTYSVYAASKYGLRGFTEALRREVNIHGINVTGIYPGGVATEFGEKAGIKRKTKISTPGFLKLTAADVAKTVFRVVQKPYRAVIIPGLMRPTVWLSVVFPGVIDKIIEWRFTKRER
ncbi:MAG: SDR family oxidoreductase [Anaerolineales bacterium]|jgi:short-subunit dehydrogenase